MGHLYQSYSKNNRGIGRPSLEVPPGTRRLGRTTIALAVAPSLWARPCGAETQPAVEGPSSWIFMHFMLYIIYIYIVYVYILNSKIKLSCFIIDSVFCMVSRNLGLTLLWSNGFLVQVPWAVDFGGNQHQWVLGVQTFHGHTILTTANTQMFCFWIISQKPEIRTTYLSGNEAQTL